MSRRIKIQRRAGNKPSPLACCGPRRCARSSPPSDCLSYDKLVSYKQYPPGVIVQEQQQQQRPLQPLGSEFFMHLLDYYCTIIISSSPLLIGVDIHENRAA